MINWVIKYANRRTFINRTKKCLIFGGRKGMDMIDRLIEIVKEASKLMLTEGFEVAQKDGYANIVTSSDVAVQEFLCRNLAELLPGSGFLCEEGDTENEDENENEYEYLWIIDPIDGTANYSRGIRECAISVGLRHGEVMEMGVVYVPRAGELFHAVRGKGAFLNGKPIHVSERPFANGVLCTALAVYHKEHARVCSDIIVDAFMECNDVRRFGAAAPELCYLAMGRCELYFEYLLQPWDYAAASLILEEAGGCICRSDGREIDSTLPSGVLAANCKESLDRLVAIARKHL